jgi:type IV secretory pathway VirB2 component (pilin)
MTRLWIRKISSKRLRLSAISFATCMTITERVHGQAKDPWDEAVQVLQTAFTGPIATGLALVAIVVGGLMFVIVRRTACEDRFLKVNLPGYTDYSGKVRNRLLPRIW